MQIIETLQQISIPFFWLSVVGFATAYALVMLQILKKPLKAAATYVLSFFL
jgi:hypothetical protein